MQRMHGGRAGFEVPGGVTEHHERHRQDRRDDRTHVWDKVEPEGEQPKHEPQVEAAQEEHDGGDGADEEGEGDLALDVPLEGKRGEGEK